MPLYEYECKTCGDIAEELIESENKNCPPPCKVCFSFERKRLPSCASFKINGYSEANGYSQK